jgi:TRAP-type C4-dicarboxylate transport system permease large subunit
MLFEALRATAQITAMIMAIMFSSQLFSQLLAFSGTGIALREFVESLSLSSGMMLLIMMAIPFVICMFLDEMAAMLILIPIYIPFLQPLNFDPVWFWTLFLINMTLGAIAPPVGYVLFVMKGVLPDVRLTELFRASVPYVLIFILALSILGTFPQLVLFPFGRH